MTAALAWAFRANHRPFASTTHGDAPRILDLVVGAPDVPQTGFRPTPWDYEYVSAVHAQMARLGCPPPERSDAMVRDRPPWLAVSRRPLLMLLGSTAKWSTGRELSVSAGLDGKPGLPAKPNFTGMPPVSTSAPRTVGGQLVGRASYEFRIKYCGLTANSWMYQKVQIDDSGHERNPDGTRGKFTYRFFTIEEIFRVGDDKCTVQPDVHHSTVTARDPNDFHVVCPLCDFMSVREAWQADNVRPSPLPGVKLNEGRPPPRIFPPGDPDKAMELDADTPNYHLISLVRTGSPCLGRENRIEWKTSRIVLRSGTTPDSHWSQSFWWATPCGDDPVPPPPPFPTQPPCGGVTGVPTFRTSPTITPDDPVLPGPEGWRRSGPDGSGREPVPAPK